MDATIIIPHKQTALNDEALKLNLAMLLHNTADISWELIIDTQCPKDPYKIWNEAAKQARGKTLVFTNSDVLMAPGWGCMLDWADPNTIVTGYLVEAGNIPVADENIERNFGRTPDTFDRKAFENFARADSLTKPVWAIQRGWYMPCAMEREWFLSTGGFPTDNGFPYPNDVLFWEHCTRDLGTTLMRVRSYAYHFQKLSDR